MKSFIIQSNSDLPKLQQTIHWLEKNIKKGEFKKNSKLPSVNYISEEFNISRKITLDAFKTLKKRGIVYAVSGKGYYVKNTEVKIKEHVFLLFDELNSFKEDLYNSIVNHMGKNANVNIFFHHFNQNVFEELIKDCKNNYTKYMIMPTNQIENVASIIALLPQQEVYILDQINDDLKKYSAVYQNFHQDIYKGLVKGKKRLEKYNKLILVFPSFREPIEMKEGFLKFVSDFDFNFEIISEFKNRTIQIGEVYILPNDRDLVNVIEKSKKLRLKLGKDFGIISYNETPLKKIVENGITTISTDFEDMGKMLAKISRSNKKNHVENKSDLIIRNSL